MIISILRSLLYISWFSYYQKKYGVVMPGKYKMHHMWINQLASFICLKYICFPNNHALKISWQTINLMYSWHIRQYKLRGEVKKFVHHQIDHCITHLQPFNFYLKVWYWINLNSIVLKRSHSKLERCCWGDIMQNL